MFDSPLETTCLSHLSKSEDSSHVYLQVLEMVNVFHSSELLKPLCRLPTMYNLLASFSTQSQLRLNNSSNPIRPQNSRPLHTLSHIQLHHLHHGPIIPDIPPKALLRNRTCTQPSTARHVAFRDMPALGGSGGWSLWF